MSVTTPATMTDGSRPSIGAGDPASGGAQDDAATRRPNVARANRGAAAWAWSLWRSAGGGLRRLVNRPQSWAAVAIAVCGPLFAILTFIAMLSGQGVSPGWMQALIVLDVIYLALAVGLIGRQIARLIIARRARSAGSQMHARMVTIFAGVSATPALILAIFFLAVIQVNFDAWFSDRVSSVVRNSKSVADAYAAEHEAKIRQETLGLANHLAVVAQQGLSGARDPRFRQAVGEATASATLYDVYVINSGNEILASGANSYVFNFSRPSDRLWAAAERGEIGAERNANESEIRALVLIPGLVDSYLYVSRLLDAEVIAALERTGSGVDDYQRLEQNRGLWTARFAAVFLGFVVLILLAAMYLGLWFAERLARPIGRLAEAAERVRAGDLEARVKEERGDDELALLSKAFNRMTTEVRRKQEALAVANAKSEERRLFSEAVLGGVSAGVVALDHQGRVGLMNDRAATLLALDPAAATGEAFEKLAPELAALLAEAQAHSAPTLEKPIRLVRANMEHEVLARITRRQGDAERRGFVLTLDDLTDLVQAQRLAAWGDVARRIAHEIKNPLTPIQLAAERLKRKFASRLGEDQETFERYTDTIVRQTGDIGRMVDAFVRFAKMPSPRMRRERLDDMLREAVLLQEEGRRQYAYRIDVAEADGPFPVRADRGQIAQALTNLLQNAADALSARLEADEAEGRQGPPPEIRATLTRRPDGAPGFRVLIEDNGVGLPLTDRARLLEPYVTTREKGTGLGLAIVAKIVEEHAGKFSLGDARAFDASGVIGAAAAIDLPPIGEAELETPGAADGAATATAKNGAKLESIGPGPAR